MANIEQTRGGIVGDGNRHPTLGRDQADIAHGTIAEVLGQLSEIFPHRSPRPICQESEPRPIIFGEEPPRPIDDPFKPLRRFFAAAHAAKPNRPPHVVGDLPAGIDRSVGDVTN